jgi:hypothetical protein
MISKTLRHWSLSRAQSRRSLSARTVGWRWRRKRTGSFPFLTQEGSSNCAIRHRRRSGVWHGGIKANRCWLPETKMETSRFSAAKAGGSASRRMCRAAFRISPGVRMVSTWRLRARTGRCVSGPSQGTRTLRRNLPRSSRRIGARSCRLPGVAEDRDSPPVATMERFASGSPQRRQRSKQGFAAIGQES